MTEPLDCLEPAWATVEEGGDFIPWPEFEPDQISYDDIHSIGFKDGRVYDWNLANHPVHKHDGWRRWNVGFVPVELLERMGMSS